MIPRAQHRVAGVLLVALVYPCSLSAGDSPGIELFADWVDLADRHRAAWQHSSADLSPERRTQAIRLADRLFGGAWGGYWSSWSGFEKAGGAHFDSRARVQVAPAEIVEPARSYLLWRLSAIRAEEARRDAGSGSADDPAFWEAYGRHVKHGNHFGFLRERAAYVIPRMMAEAALGDALHKDGGRNIAGAYAMLASARWQLARALDYFEQGKVDTGVFFVTDAVDTLRQARAHGARPVSVRAMLHDGFGDRLASGEPLVSYQGRSLTFRESLQDGIAFLRNQTDRRRGFDLRPLADLFFDGLGDGPVESSGDLEERVVVTAEAVYLNIEGYLLRELEVVVDDAAGLPVLQRYADIDVQGKLLFFALLAEESGAARYARIRGNFRDWLTGEHGVAQDSEQELTRIMIGMGSRLFTVPGVVDELRRTPRGEKLAARMSALDPPALHAHIGDLWLGRARLLRELGDPGSEPTRRAERIEALAAARMAYRQAALRFPPGEAPAVLESLTRQIDARLDRARRR